MKFVRTLLFALILACCFTNYGFCEEILRLATTTSTYESGILDHIFPEFEKRNNCKIHIISVGTGKAIQLGRNGDVDIILVHAREAEMQFVEAGFGVDRRDVMYNDFLILGPADDPARISGLKDAKEALSKIYDSGSIFVSRGDDSGTDKKEKSLWEKTGRIPGGKVYLETGQGMSHTLRIADEKNAYTLVDRSTYLFHLSRIRLQKMVEGDKELFNPYGVIAINPKRYPHVNYFLSKLLTEWLTSPECAGLINGYKVNGRQLFHVDN
ncbi:MAG: substrate-binding domain-containing protein [Candidatus Omnitrophota bacterium]